MKRDKVQVGKNIIEYQIVSLSGGPDRVGAMISNGGQWNIVVEARDKKELKDKVRAYYRDALNGE